MRKYVLERAGEGRNIIGQKIVFWEWMARNPVDVIIEEAGEAIGYLLKILKERDRGAFTNKQWKCFCQLRHTNPCSFLQIFDPKKKKRLGIKSVKFDGSSVLKTLLDLAEGIIGTAVSNQSHKEAGLLDYLLESYPSLVEFHRQCRLIFGVIESDIDDEVYYKMALFEIKVRLVADRDNIRTWDKKRNEQRPLSRVIEDLGDPGLKEANAFLNKVKHSTNPRATEEHLNKGLQVIEKRADKAWDDAAVSDCSIMLKSLDILSEDLRDGYAEVTGVPRIWRKHLKECAACQEVIQKNVYLRKALWERLYK